MGLILKANKLQLGPTIYTGVIWLQLFLGLYTVVDAIGLKDKLCKEVGI